MNILFLYFFLFTPPIYISVIAHSSLIKIAKRNVSIEADNFDTLDNSDHTFTTDCVELYFAKDLIQVTLWFLFLRGITINGSSST